MDAYALHLAMAALVGASFVAVSAYYMHRKTLTQLLEFARAIERERERERERDTDGAAAEDDDVADKPPTLVYKRAPPGRGGQQSYRRRAVGYYRRGSMSASLPDVMAAAEVVGEEAEQEERLPQAMNGPFLHEDRRNGIMIPQGLPRLHVVLEGTHESEPFPSDFSPE